MSTLKFYRWLWLLAMPIMLIMPIMLSTGLQAEELGGGEIEKSEQLQVQGGFYVEGYTTQPWIHVPLKLDDKLSLLLPLAPKKRTLDRQHDFGEADSTDSKLLFKNLESSLHVTAADQNGWQFIDHYRYPKIETPSEGPPPILIDLFIDLFKEMFNSPERMDLQDLWSGKFAAYPGIYYEGALTLQPGYRLVGFCFCHQNRLIHFKFVFAGDLLAKTSVSYKEFVQAFMDQVQFIEN